MIKISSKNIDTALNKHIIACSNWINEIIIAFEKALKGEKYKPYFGKNLVSVPFNRVESIKNDSKLIKMLERIIDYLKNEDLVKDIIKSKSPDLMNINSKYNCNLFYQTEFNKKTGIIDYIFNYQKFSNESFPLTRKDEYKKEGPNEYWNAYELVKLLNITTCHYCNRNYIFKATRNNRKKGTRPELDHFYPQNNYPFLRLSFYNLIPSCHTCNHLKLNKHNGLISPYDDDLIEKFNFKHLPQDVNSLYGYGNNHQVILSPIKNYENRIKIHDETFLLNQLYSNYGDLIQELIIKKRIAGKEYFSMIKKLFRGAISDNEIKRFAFGNYLNEKDFHKRPLSKFIFDIAQDLKLI